MANPVLHKNLEELVDYAGNGPPGAVEAAFSRLQTIAQQEAAVAARNAAEAARETARYTQDSARYIKWSVIVLAISSVATLTVTILVAIFK